MPLVTCSLSPVIPFCNCCSQERRKSTFVCFSVVCMCLPVCVCSRERTFTLCPQLRDSDHIGQLLLSGLREMSEMCLCVSAGSYSDILHCCLFSLLVSQLRRQHQPAKLQSCPEMAPVIGPQCWLSVAPAHFISVELRLASSCVMFVFCPLTGIQTNKQTKNTHTHTHYSPTFLEKFHLEVKLRKSFLSEQK